MTLGGVVKVKVVQLTISRGLYLRRMAFGLGVDDQALRVENLYQRLVLVVILVVDYDILVFYE